MDFRNKIIWLTGGSSGIGEALVYAFLDRGATVIASSEDHEGLIRVRNTCREEVRERCHIVPFDLEISDEIHKTVEEQIGNFGRIDILLNIGGISQRSLIKETSFQIDRRIMEINYFGTIAFTKAVLPYMIKQGFGHIVATTSLVGTFGFPLRSAYSASKHALHGFFETLRSECRSENIQVTILIPGRVRTNISIHALTKEGLQHGQMDHGQASGISPDKAARQIIRAIMKKKKEALIGGKELVMFYIRKFFPGIFYQISSKMKPT
ncbi:MAG: SDR family NAD(P)-dependent oxidoreductase [Bacteroidales bacterium]|nr:MAG: SDR family NAD(P)-dependent oxidoreductase [Bacteroidales bacterium]